MARENTRRKPKLTHEGAVAAVISDEQALRRSVMSCLLGEEEFYESGVEIKERIKDLVRKVDPEVAANIAREARDKFKLRHVPLYIVAALSSRDSKAKGTSLVSNLIEDVVRRADEIGELLAIYWGMYGPDTPISAQIKTGLASAFRKFDAYQFAKYDRDAKVTLSDAIRLIRPKPRNAEEAQLWGLVRLRKLPPADTWETMLSGGASKAETFTGLIKSGRLGYMALLRNLRGMDNAGVDRELVNDAIRARKGAKDILPFRYLAAFRSAPMFEEALDDALKSAIGELDAFDGETVILVDVSGSMFGKPMSGKGSLNRGDAAAALAAMFPGKARVFSFSEAIVEIPNATGIVGIDRIIRSQRHVGTLLIEAVRKANEIGYDRLIVITDEQAAVSDSSLPAPLPRSRGAAYMINVASAQNGIGYGNGWVHIDGFSEAVLRFIAEYERG